MQGHVLTSDIEENAVQDILVGPKTVDIAQLDSEDGMGVVAGYDTTLHSSLSVRCCT